MPLTSLSEMLSFEFVRIFEFQYKFLIDEHKVFISLEVDGESKVTTSCQAKK